MVLSAREHIRQKNEKFNRLRRLKSDLAKSVLLRVHEELAAKPNTEQFSTTLLRDTDQARNQLRKYPTEISERVQVLLGRSVGIELDESVEPPRVIISIGKSV